MHFPAQNQRKELTQHSSRNTTTKNAVWLRKNTQLSRKHTQHQSEHEKLWDSGECFSTWGRSWLDQSSRRWLIEPTGPPSKRTPNESIWRFLLGFRKTLECEKQEKLFFSVGSVFLLCGKTEKRQQQKKHRKSRVAKCDLNAGPSYDKNNNT